MSKRLRPTLAGIAALRPRPMSSAEVADLVSRVRVAELRLHRSTEIHLVRWQPISATRCAARYVELARCSYREAAQAFGLRNLERLRLWHHRYYPGRRPPRFKAPKVTFKIGTAQFPPGSTCAICTGPCTGELHREPLGRNGAQVNVCIACRTEVVRERDHLFGGSSRGVGVGEGNRHTRAR